PRLIVLLRAFRLMEFQHQLGLQGGAELSGRGLSIMDRFMELITVGWQEGKGTRVTMCRRIKPRRPVH
ncbi:MAG: hypothetical protein K2N78_03825, partial [Oscillospiraceae bacterium]|nr:hypothetical protein [Oscillospiraceae bacterium]